MMNNMMNPMGMNQIMINQIELNKMINNQIGMNNIGMNNQMNPIGIDQTTINIKNIVKPYENKIKELEEQIRQKDFEITVLKQKLNNNNQNINLMNMNLNPMIMNQNINPMLIGESFNQSKVDKFDEITINFKNKNEELIVNCKARDKVSILREKFNIKWKNFFTCNYKQLDEEYTFRENRIMDYDTIEVKSGTVHNLIFKDVLGRTLSLCLSYDCPLNIALTYYLLKRNNPIELFSLLIGELKLSFLSNSTLNFKDKTPLGEVFKWNPHPKIIVNYS